MTDSEAAADRPDHHRSGGGFRNPPGSPRQNAGLREFLRFLLIDIRRAKVPPIPPGHVSDRPPDLSAPRENEIGWLGHASFALRMAGKLILTAPYLSRTAGPFGLGPKRFVPAAVAAEDLPRLDLIALSHNHYDHITGDRFRRAARDQQFGEANAWTMPIGGVRAF